MDNIRLSIAGVGGQMGQALIVSANQGENAGAFLICGGSEHSASPLLNTPILSLCASGPEATAARAHIADNEKISADPKAAAYGADVWIDFTRPEASMAAIEALSGSGIAFVIGTTGLSEADKEKLADAAKTNPIVYSGNYSLGVNLLAALVEKATHILGPDWDVEIIEAHHRRKVDAPSGTALMLGEAAAKGRGDELSNLRLPVHDGITGARKAGGIGFAAVRAGAIVGDHQVMIASDDEMLVLGHHAQSRSLFARGALAAAAWVKGKPAGLYSMADVLADKLAQIG